MYEGCNKTAIASQAAIAEALIELMKVKPYSRISVSEICKCAGVSRQTFYSLFASKDNVVSFILERKYCFRPQDHECCRSSMTLEDICHAYSLYITERKDMIVLLVRNDILYLMQDRLYSSFIYSEDYLPGYPAQDRVYAADFLAGGLTGVARNYARPGTSTSREHLEEILFSLSSAYFFR